tara:strand:+ start:1290 stop:2000 length:711 start_codon:yes stop_codon:yes gene_type:complete
MNVLVVNGSGSIGSALVSELTNDGANVVYTSSKNSDSYPSESIHWKYRGEDSVRELFEDLKSKIDRLDALVNCLGSIFLKPAHLTKTDDFDDVLDINLRSSFFIIREAIPMMKKNGGNMLFFSSAASNIGLANHEAIAAAKGGLEGLVRSTAATYSKNNIRVNAIALGMVESNLSSKIISNPMSLEISKKMHSLGRIGSPDSVSKIAKQLIIDENSWITGSIINLDGGLATTKIAS